MKLTDNKTVYRKLWAGAVDWGTGYMRRQEGWIDTRWYEGRHGSDRLLEQWILEEVPLWS